MIIWAPASATARTNGVKSVVGGTGATWISPMSTPEPAKVFSTADLTAWPQA